MSTRFTEQSDVNRLCEFSRLNTLMMKRDPATSRKIIVAGNPPPLFVDGLDLILTLITNLPFDLTPSTFSKSGGGLARTYDLACSLSGAKSCPR